MNIYFTDMKAADLTKRPAAWWSIMDRHLRIDLTSWITVTVPEAEIHCKIIVFQIIADIICEWQL